jgi:hypothetical protein
MSIILAEGILYIRQNGASIEYSSSSTFSSAQPVAWPVTVINTTPSIYLKVYFTTDIIITGGPDRFFICGSAYIQFGNTTLNPNGTRPTITIQDIINYPGLIRNGSNTESGKNNIVVVNLNVLSTGTTTLALDGGWIGQTDYSRGVAQCKIVYCSSNGYITENGGGIVGARSGPFSTVNNLQITYCNSSGDIDLNSGGIAGNFCNNILVTNCFSTGNMPSGYGGGIFGSNMTITNATVQYSYSTGNILSDRSGGICGGFARGNIIGCYSTGNITGAINATGIFGVFPRGTSIVSNCYCIGLINNQGGGTAGVIPNTTVSGVPLVTNTYTSGATTSGAFGGIYTDINFDGPSNYSEANNNSFGWKDINAAATLQGVGTIWGSIASDTHYVLLNFGVSPYSLDVIDSTTYALNQTYSQTIQAGQSTIPAQVAGFKIFQILSGGHSTISIDNTGKISTTSSTPPGTYTLMVYGVDDYTTTTFILIVTGTPIIAPNTQLVIPPCCEPNVCNTNPQASNYNSNVIVQKKSGKAIDRSVDDLYTGVATGQRTAYSQPVFKSYYDYMNYLQGKYR